MNPSPKRKVRGERSRNALPIVLTERDYHLLQLVGLAGYVTTAQLARDMFPTSDRASRRLRQLYDAALIRVHLAGSSRPNLLSLTPSGKDAVLGYFGPTAGLQLPSTIPLHAIDHHLRVVDVRILLSALERREVLHLDHWHGGRSALAALTGLTRAKLVPDGLAEVTMGGYGILAIEVDRATERLTGALAPKLERYAAPLSSRVISELWLYATGSEARLAAVRRLCVEAGVARWTRMFNDDDVLRRPAGLPNRLA